MFIKKAHFNGIHPWLGKNELSQTLSKQDQNTLGLLMIGRGPLADTFTLLTQTDAENPITIQTYQNQMTLNKNAPHLTKAKSIAQIQKELEQKCLV